MTPDQHGALGLLAMAALWLIWADMARPSWLVAGLLVVVALVFLVWAVYICVSGTIIP